MPRDHALRTAGAGLLALLPALALAPAEAAAGAICPATERVDLMAGQHTNAGDVKVCNDGEALTITYEPTGPWCVADTNLHVATALDGIPRTQSGNPKPDEFAYGGPPEWDECTVTVVIPLEEIGTEGVAAEDTVWIAAQADLFVLEGTRREGAWAAGTRFTERGPWATYFTYTVAEPPCGGAGSCTVFVTSTSHDGNLGGLRGADAICNARASEAGLVGTYKAWLSDGANSPSTRFTRPTVPYRLVNGTQIAQNWSDLTDETLDAAIDRTEAGGQLSLSRVWTNTAANGTSGSGSHCGQWFTSSTFSGGIFGATDGMLSTWTWWGIQGCPNFSHLYCFQQ